MIVGFLKVIIFLSIIMNRYHQILTIFMQIVSIPIRWFNQSDFNPTVEKIFYKTKVKQMGNIFLFIINIYYGNWTHCSQFLHVVCSYIHRSIIWTAFPRGHALKLNFNTFWLQTILSFIINKKKPFKLF